MGKYTMRWDDLAQFTAYLRDVGAFSSWSAAALGGQMAQESVGDPAILGDQGTALGLFQWRGARRKKLAEMAKAQGTREDSWALQLDFAIWELANTHKADGAAIRQAGNLDQALEAAIGFVRPKGWTRANPRKGDGWAKRKAAAEKLLGMLQDRDRQEEVRKVNMLAARAEPANLVAITPASAKPPGVFEAAVRRTPKGFLELGDAGATVQTLQRELADYGYPLKGSGYFGPATLAAVKDFQRLESLMVDGQAGPETAARLDFYHGRRLPAPPAIEAQIARPLWLTEGLRLLGTTEKIGKGSNPEIIRWAKAEGGAVAKAFTDDDIAWCSLFANHLLTAVGLPGTETLWALDWDSDKTWPNTKLSGPAVGAFIPMRRDGGGHIAVIVGRDRAGNFAALGGNQSNTVSVAPIVRTRPLSFRWPRGPALPLRIGFDSLPLVDTRGVPLNGSEA